MKYIQFLIILFAVTAMLKGCTTAYKPVSNQKYFSKFFWGEEVLFYSDSLSYIIRCPIGECRIIYSGLYKGGKRTVLYRTVQPNEGSFISSFEEKIKLKIRVKDSCTIILDGKPFVEGTCSQNE